MPGILGQQTVQDIAHDLIWLEAFLLGFEDLLDQGLLVVIILFEDPIAPNQHKFVSFEALENSDIRIADDQLFFSRQIGVLLVMKIAQTA